eukprot:CAMPEP_0170557094 /NCGR_PEP_ID=MMETSP0211-20121228/19192_1 /TAXON_ID=311385 /ORGANISM="Pseudokeronopsis sp., Strain OXSARD2" /LENGTH=77 /DNA_ID=CAMNT_0010867809 /DNA_START=146 /DNA_END=379 /DNA_ORIENTATION=-
MDEYYYIGLLVGLFMILFILVVIVVMISKNKCLAFISCLTITVFFLCALAASIAFFWAYYYLPPFIQDQCTDADSQL